MLHWIKNLAIALALPALAAVVAGCSTVLPTTAAINRVHDLYRAEFLEAPFPSQAEFRNRSGTASTNRATAFGQTLAAITEYRRRFPDRRAELAHLQVLEGMIYLQSHRFGMADLVAKDIARTTNDLRSGSRKVTRDLLLALNFADLSRGWRETLEVPNSGLASTNHVNTLTRAASNIIERLAPLTNATVYLPDRDAGALYLANSAAVFLVRASDDVPGGADPELRKEWYRLGRDALSWFLSTNETSKAASTNFGGGAAGRLRHIQWYHFLDQRISSTP